ncbi:isoleucine--tRNA ligase [Sesbania bispinosa]|nr:isoleucine--tRNA ligase [Sesbania bispinosa]
MAARGAATHWLEGKGHATEFGSVGSGGARLCAQEEEYLAATHGGEERNSAHDGAATILGHGGTVARQPWRLRAEVVSRQRTRSPRWWPRLNGDGEIGVAATIGVQKEHGRSHGWEVGPRQR